MNQSVVTTPNSRVSEVVTDDVTELESKSTVQGVLDALYDADCRAILVATGDEALSAGEISETCDLPLSTTYRKLSVLTEAGLLEGRTRVQRRGKHPTEYVRCVEDVVLSIGSSGAKSVRLFRRETEGSSDFRFSAQVK